MPQVTKFSTLGFGIELVTEVPHLTLTIYETIRKLVNAKLTTHSTNYVTEGPFCDSCDFYAISKRLMPDSTPESLGNVMVSTPPSNLATAFELSAFLGRRRERSTLPKVLSMR
jgi:hypothetical protein